MSPFASLSKADFWEGLAIAVAVALLSAGQEGLTEHGINFGMYDWAAIGDLAWKAGVAYLATMFGTDKDGKFLGAVQIRSAR